MEFRCTNSMFPKTTFGQLSSGSTFRLGLDQEVLIKINHSSVNAITLDGGPLLFTNNQMVVVPCKVVAVEE